MERLRGKSHITREKRVISYHRLSAMSPQHMFPWRLLYFVNTQTWQKSPRQD